ncbi:hypothetical protein [Streptomyces sp. H27-C3]|uniref:hypothetical protein n=1 Tax=Streptomyces sp. H27-C3 TaxID=3046305 RepID=UPI0024BB4235|nr:hypothetical protein [Streptomyces sp. H27-C3]MDJ0463832.1 hypothetical protein [Streptomyces sp. H27-C3]
MSTRTTFDPEVVQREMRVIREDLHCTAVRVTGGDPDRLEIAATHAAGAGLEVWLCPFTCGLTTDELLAFLADCAERAERLRTQGAEIVFLTGSELSLFTHGFLPGDTLQDRIGLLSKPHNLREVHRCYIAEVVSFLDGGSLSSGQDRGMSPSGAMSWAASPDSVGSHKPRCLAQWCRRTARLRPRPSVFDRPGTSCAG